LARLLAAELDDEEQPARHGSAVPADHRGGWNSVARVALLPLPQCDSDDRRARSDRKLACGRRRAYAPDATGLAEWRFCCSSAANVSLAPVRRSQAGERCGSCTITSGSHPEIGLDSTSTTRPSAATSSQRLARAPAQDRYRRELDDPLRRGLEVQRHFEINEYTDTHHDYATVPQTRILSPGLVIEKVYVGYWFWGRPVQTSSSGPTSATSCAAPRRTSTRTRRPRGPPGRTCQGVAAAASGRAPVDTRGRPE
jgi:hypothetical protein